MHRVVFNSRSSPLNCDAICSMKFTLEKFEKNATSSQDGLVDFNRFLSTSYDRNISSQFAMSHKGMKNVVIVRFRIEIESMAFAEMNEAT